MSQTHFGESYLITLSGLVGGILGAGFNELLHNQTWKAFGFLIILFLFMWAFVWVALRRYKQ